MAFFSKSPRKAESSEVVTVIGPEAYFHGVITVRGSLRVEGEVEGNVTEAQTVIVGKGGRIQGDVCGEFVVVGGAVTGDVIAAAQLELKAGGKILGDIRTPKLLIEEGAVFEGSCNMSGSEPAREAAEKPSRRKQAEESQSLPS